MKEGCGRHRRLCVFVVAVLLLVLMIVVIICRSGDISIFGKSKTHTTETRATEILNDDKNTTNSQEGSDLTEQSEDVNHRFTISDDSGMDTVSTCTSSTEDRDTTETVATKPTQDTTTNCSVCVEEEVVTTTEYIVTTQMTEASNTSTEHTHSFVVQVTHINHPEEGHYEEVCVSQGYEEEIYESYDMCCRACGAVMDDWSLDELMAHSSMHGAYGTAQVVVDTIWHEPVYEQVWVVDMEEYNEEVIVEKCSVCGYVR